MNEIHFTSTTRQADNYNEVYESFQDAIYTLEDAHKEYLDRSRKAKSREGQKFWKKQAHEALRHRNVLSDFYHNLYVTDYTGQHPL